MSIIFHKVKWKNFLSTGNNWTEMNLQDYSTNLIVGHNGAGKSTMLDAIAFGLFGKAHRNISKPQLVNSINKKNCVVEVSFTALGSTYRVVRGIKPTIFEIWQGETMLNQSSHAKEYQKILEQNILKLNHKSFHQIVVLGSSSFIPFMQLSAQARREVIEDLLDIGVFSTMNQILKEKTSHLKSQILETDHEIGLCKTKQDAQKKYIKDIKAIQSQAKEEKLKLIDSTRNEIETLHGQNTALSTEVSERLLASSDAHSKIEKKIQALLGYKGKFEAEIKVLVKEVEFFQNNGTCPSCSQPITDETKQTHIMEGKERANNLKTAHTECVESIAMERNALEASQKVLEELKEKQNQIHINNQQIGTYQDIIDRTNTEVSKLNGSYDIDQAENDLLELSETHDSLVNTKLELNEQFNYNHTMSMMLKDTGIKTKIVKQYIPVINKFVNNYLQTLDFFVQFTLDESFTESIKSRYRDDFSYASFSEGEKQRIDLALLFTWRQIAKMKNSIATNLLVLDETFDSSLDHDGIDNLMKIIRSLGEDTNVFVISHKGEMLDGKFANKIEFHKDKNFSKII